eukprot:2777685-Prymnesium_polylepis.1
MGSDGVRWGQMGSHGLVDEPAHLGHMGSDGVRWGQMGSDGLVGEPAHLALPRVAQLADAPCELLAAAPHACSQGVR